MRIFTLGKKGVPLLFFALFLFSGTTMYGQEGCPTPGGTDSEQSFCYLQTIGDIVTDGSAVYQTADNVNDTQPIPEDELLTDGVTYYVGGTSGDCERIAVTVTVNVVERPTNTIFPNSPSFEITPCSSTNFTADDLASYFNATQTGYQVEVYTTQFGTNEAEGELTPGESYFVGQVSTTDEDACPSLRAAVGYNPITPVPPVATSPQVFCEGATVADLQAEGTYDNTQAIRWYRTAAANSPLADDIQLINGQTYYATQIVNDRNSPFPPCESDVTPVIVEVQNLDAGEQVGDGIYCQSEIDSRLETTPADQLVRELFTEQLESGVPTDGTFENLSINQIITQYQNGVRSFSTIYTIANELGCEDSVELSFSIEEDPYAGEDTNLVFCQSEITDFIQLALIDRDAAEAALLGMVGEDVDTGGTFSTDLNAIATAYLAAIQENDFPFNIETTYVVDEGTACEDSSEISLTVNQDVNLDPSYSRTICNAGLDESIDDIGQVRALFTDLLPSGVPKDGSFNPSINTIINQYGNNPLGSFSTNYTVGEGSCEASTVLTITTAEPIEANAGNIDNITLGCTSNSILILDDSILGADSTPGGTFSAAQGVLNEEGNFDPSIGTGDYEITYSVTEEDDPCITGSASTTFIISVTTGGANAGADNSGEVCNAGLDESIDDIGQVRALFTNLLSPGVPKNGSFNPSISDLINQYGNNPLGDFTTTYTIGEGECQDSVELTITVVEPTPADAGEIDGFSICSSEDPLNLYTYLNIEAGFGEFTTTNGPIEGGNLNISSIGVIDVTYTVNEGNAFCVTGSDVAMFEVEIIQGAYAGEDATVNLEETDTEIIDLFDALGGNPDEGGTWTPGDGSFNPATDMAGVYIYTVGTGDCTDSATVTVTIGECTITAGADNSGTVCNAGLDESIDDIGQVRALFTNLLDAGVPKTGTFQPTLTQLMNQYLQNNIGDFTTTYTVSEGDCSDSAVLTITVVEPVPAEAGEIEDISICSPEENLVLSTLLGEDSAIGGIFSGTGVTNNLFDPSIGVGEYQITYSVNEDTSCVIGSDSTSFTVSVLEGGNAGADVSVEYCISEVEDMTQAEVITLFNSLVSEDADDDGEFSPSIESLIAQFASNPIGTFTTSYTVSENECSDSANISVTITDVVTANAGSDTSLVFCISEGSLDLTDYLNANADQTGSFEELSNNMFDPSEVGAGTYTFTYTVDESSECVEGSDSSIYTVEVVETANAGGDKFTEVCNSQVRSLSPTGVRNLYLNLLDADVTRNGSFNPSIQQLIDQYNMQSNIGDFTTVYTVGSGDCQDSTELTVTVLANPNAGQSVTVNLEEDTTETVDLFDELGGTPEADGTWTFDGEEVDGTFDPATDEEGVYTYTVTSENGCSASATVTVVIGTQEQNCPEVTVTEQTFCDSEPTVADLMPAGVLWYSSTDATEALDVTTVLVDGSVYYAGPVEGICDDRPSVTVTLSDSPAVPTVTPFTQCDVDGATIADLDITGEADATFTVYSDETLATEVGSTEELTEGTYYVTQTNVAGCVSDAASLTVSFSNSDAPVLVSNAECLPIDGTLADLEEIVSANGDITWYATATSTDPLSRMTTLTDGTIYYATSTNDEGCESSTRLAVTADFCPIVIPEIFTPNGDGINDYFAITGISAEYPNHMLEIYNRWGEPVYVGKGENPGWDGTSTEGSIGSGVLPVGVYFYILYYNDGQTAPTQGKLYLSR